MFASDTERFEVEGRRRRAVPRVAWRRVGVASGTALARTGLMVGILAGLAACEPTLDWRQIRPAGWQLGVHLPCRPDQHERQVQLAGRSVAMGMVSCRADDHLFAVTSADVQEPQHVTAALQALADTAAANVQGQVRVKLPAQVRGMTPNPNAGLLDLQGRGPDGQPLRFKALFFAHGSRVFQASVLGPRSDERDSSPLFDSLEITPQ